MVKIVGNRECKTERFKLFIRFVLAKAAISYGLELMMGFFSVIQGIMGTIMDTTGIEKLTKTHLPDEIITAVEDTGFFESIPIWAVTLIGGLVIWALACIIFSVIAKANPSFDDELTAAAMVSIYRTGGLQHADSGRDCKNG